MAKFYLEDETIVSYDRLVDEYYGRGAYKPMNEYLSNITGGTLEEASKDTESWNKVISGTKRNSDGTPDLGDVSDGYHTFNELYEHRGVLFWALCNAIVFSNNSYNAFGQDLKMDCWYSKQHSDGTMFPGMFIAGISTPYGSCTYHFEEKYMTLFDNSNIPYLEQAPEWDGNSPEQGLEALKATFGLIK